jgi:hypothetical protein
VNAEEGEMPKLASTLLMLGVIVLLGLGWAARSETAYYWFYHLRDLTGDLFGLWAIPKSSKLIDEGTFSTRMIVQITISVLLAALSLFVISSDRYASKQQGWAYATIGVLLGFWLKA